MIKIKERFNEYQSLNNGVSSYINFVRAIKGLKVTPKNIRKSFNQLVDKSDYQKNEYRDIMNYVLENR